MSDPFFYFPWTGQFLVFYRVFIKINMRLYSAAGTKRHQQTTMRDWLSAADNESQSI